MNAIDRFKQKVSKLPNEYWFFNYIASFIMYFVMDSHQYLSLFLFPVTIAALHYVLENYVDLKEFRQFLGYFPIPRTLINLLAVMVVNFIIWDHAAILLLGCFLFMYLNDRQI